MILKETDRYKTEKMYHKWKVNGANFKHFISFPAQKAKTTKEWLWRNLLALISTKNWFSGSADLKTLDTKLWAVLEDMACQKHHNSLESLRRSLVKAAVEIPLGNGACGDRRMAGASQGLCRSIEQPF
jgi:hypothetical protein